MPSGSAKSKSKLLFIKNKLLKTMFDVNYSDSSDALFREGKFSKWMIFTTWHLCIRSLMIKIVNTIILIVIHSQYSGQS